MRTTITLEPDTEALLKRLMKERGISFKQAVNQAIRAGLSPRRPSKRRAASTPTFHMGFEPTIPWDQALRVADELEDDELIRKLAARK